MKQTILTVVVTVITTLAVQNAVQVHNAEASINYPFCPNWNELSKSINGAADTLPGGGSATDPLHWNQVNAMNAAAIYKYAGDQFGC